MRFYVYNSSDYNISHSLEKYPQLKRFFSGTYGCIGWLTCPEIEINTLEDLKWIIDNVQDRIIISREAYGAMSLEIYDDYRE